MGYGVQPRDARGWTFCGRAELAVPSRAPQPRYCGGVLYSDDKFGENDHPEPEDFALPYASVNRKPARSNSVLVAAFSGLMIALGWEEPKEQPTIVASVDGADEGWLELNFGSLEPLGHGDDETH